MLRLMPVLALSLLCSAASAQSLYKCRIDGKLTYSGAPCKEAPSTAIEVPEAPDKAPGAANADDLKRQQAISAKMAKERHVREAQDERLQAAASRVAAKRLERCAKLRLEKKWADEKAGRAASLDKEPLAEKARHMGEALAIECPG